MGGSNELAILEETNLFKRPLVKKIQWVYLEGYTKYVEQLTNMHYLEEAKQELEEARIKLAQSNRLEWTLHGKSGGRSTKIVWIQSVRTFRMSIDTLWQEQNLAKKRQERVKIAQITNIMVNEPLLESTKEKLSQFCHVPAGNILNICDVPNIWHVPLLLRDQKAHEAILKQLNILSISKSPALEEWTKRTDCYDNLTIPVKIAMVGKYTGLSDSYLSVLKALLHACIACSMKLSVEWVAASDLEDVAAKEKPDVHATAWSVLKGAAGVLVPGGFGDRGVQGKILAAKYARENGIPYLGICLGMQISVIEFARSVLGLEGANSTEFDLQTLYPCVIFMPEGSKTHMGSTMRLGSRRTFFQTSDCITAKLYQKVHSVDERHRHRYEVNPDMVEEMEKAGLKFVGRDESGRRMEIMELPSHPFYVGVQFHPEFKSRPGKPSAVFLDCVENNKVTFALTPSQLQKLELEGLSSLAIQVLFSCPGQAVYSVVAVEPNVCNWWCRRKLQFAAFFIWLLCLLYMEAAFMTKICLILAASDDVSNMVKDQMEEVLVSHLANKNGNCITKSASIGVLKRNLSRLLKWEHTMESYRKLE
eukprot:Gb_19182 [translate_table: standard]